MLHDTERSPFTLSLETLRRLDSIPGARDAQGTHPTTTVNTILTGCC